MSEEKKSAGRPGVYRGDEVYFDCASGPRVGRVLAHGRHGCTVECAKGKRHRVKWGKVLGHKKRSELRYSVLEEGEDGMIVADASGRRRFIGVQAADAPERIIMRDGEPKAVPVATPKVEDPGPAPSPESRDNPDTEKPGPELRKSECFPTILLWSGRF